MNLQTCSYHGPTRSDGHAFAVVDRHAGRRPGIHVLHAASKDVDVRAKPDMTMELTAKAACHPMEIRRGCASLAFGRVSVSTPSSSWALICSWSILLDSVNVRV